MTKSLAWTGFTLAALAGTAEAHMGHPDVHGFAAHFAAHSDKIVFAGLAGLLAYAAFRQIRRG